MRTKALLLLKYLHCLNSLSSKYYFVVLKNLYAFLFFWNPLTLRLTWQAINFSLQYDPWIKNWRLRELRKGSPTKEALNGETNSSCQPSRTCIENRIVNMHMLVKQSVIVKAREVWVGCRRFTRPDPNPFVFSLCRYHCASFYWLNAWNRVDFFLNFISPCKSLTKTWLGCLYFQVYSWLSYRLSQCRTLTTATEIKSRREQEGRTKLYFYLQMQHVQEVFLQ